MITDQLKGTIPEEETNFFRHGYTTISTNLHIALKYSIYMVASFAFIFLIARVTGFYKHTEYRFINYFLYFPIGFAAMKQAYRENGNYLEYFNGLGVAFMTTIIGQFW